MHRKTFLPTVAALAFSFVASFGQKSVDPITLKKEIESMRVKDVAWRKIAWKTCLLDGLKASREENKPLVLWVFIDRPIDDKRC